MIAAHRTVLRLDPAGLSSLTLSRLAALLAALAFQGTTGALPRNPPVGSTPEHLFGADAIKHRDIGGLSPINLTLWNGAAWIGVGVGAASGEVSPPFMTLAYKNIDAGLKILRGWQKNVGQADCGSWIGLTLITGIHRDRQPHYSVAIGVGKEYMRGQIPGLKRLLTMVYRMYRSYTSGWSQLGTPARLVLVNRSIDPPAGPL